MLVVVPPVLGVQMAFMEIVDVVVVRHLRVTTPFVVDMYVLFGLDVLTDESLVGLRTREGEVAVPPQQRPGRPGQHEAGQSDHDDGSAWCDVHVRREPEAGSR